MRIVERRGHRINMQGTERGFTRGHSGHVTKVPPVKGRSPKNS